MLRSGKLRFGANKSIQHSSKRKGNNTLKPRNSKTPQLTNNSKKMTAIVSRKPLNFLNSTASERASSSATTTTVAASTGADSIAHTVVVHTPAEVIRPAVPQLHAPVHHLPPSQIIYAAPLTPHIQPVKKINWTGCIVQGCLPMVGGSHRVLQLLPSLKLVAMILLKVALNTINQSINQW